MNTNNKYLIVIGGPTASGKTDLAIALAKHFGCSIISADSRQFYRQMSIGTAKPSQEEQSQAKHYFVDSLDIQEHYSVGDFERDVLLLLDELHRHSNLVILAGGSGLYHKAVCEGLDEFPAIDPEFTTKTELIYKKEGLQGLQNQIQKLDPDYYQKADIFNTQRMKRALSVCYATGEAYSAFLQKNKKKRNFTPLYFCTDVPRELLYEKINLRVDRMIEAGLEIEARSLLDFQNTNALQTVGYKEWFSYWKGDYPTVDFTVDKIKQHSRNYAKRQITWFKHQGDYVFINPEDPEGLIRRIEAII